MKLGIIGCGNMGSAIIKALLKNDFCKKEDIIALENNQSKIDALEIKAASSTDNLLSKLKDESYLVIAVKPQSFNELAKSLKNKIPKTTTVISIMAGVSIQNLAESLNHQKIVRAMPNTPAMIGEGMTVWMATPQAQELNKLDKDSPPDKGEMSDFVGQRGSMELAELLASFGKELQVTNENLIHAATAISGSGPAYLFALAEAWTQAAVDLGFTKEQATLLVQQTIKGSQKLMEESQESPTLLKQKVTSKGGTTEAALIHLDHKNWQKSLQEAIKKANLKSQKINY